MIKNNSKELHIVRHINKLNEVLENIVLTVEEEKVLFWLSNQDDYTVDAVISLIKKVSKSKN